MSAFPATVGSLQDYLEQLYELEAALRIEDFLLTDACVVRALEGAGYRPLPEKLLLQQSADELQVALYLDPELLARLAAAKPPTALCATELEDFWTALEGVSHFLYLVWNAHHERSVRPVELELQAEVDKYVVTTLLGTEGDELAAGRIHELLFERTRFDPSLGGELLERYREANRSAARYCLSLARRYAALRHPELLRELRRFYRLDHLTKLRFIARH